LLDAHPELHRRVGMLALLDPSRQDIPEYAEYLAAIEREARRVNDRFQQHGWSPIELRVKDDFPASVAAYKEFDILLVNAIFDGMNLVAKEAPLVNARDGVVVLSENTGAHAELGEWALSVNPFDVEGQAAAIHEAIEMDTGERRRRLDAIRKHVREHAVNEWLDLQLAALDRVSATARH
jgi:trehalose 6-phosphate synthase